jgi:hypothetical protein
VQAPEAQAVSARDARKLESDAWLRSSGVVKVGRFADPVYYLLDPLTWSLGGETRAVDRRVQVPSGFVFDGAAVPRVFFSVMRPSTENFSAFVLLEYLYWTQTGTRDEADQMFQLALQDLSIDRATISALYVAVRNFGQAAWSENARLKALGERRVLVEFPDNPKVTWEDWKRRPNVFGNRKE